MTTYLPGSFFVVDVPGPGGWWIKLGQALAGDASRFAHAGLILDGDGTILEAEPGGARIAHISEYAGDGLLISDGPVQSWLAKNPGVYGDATEGVLRAAIRVVARKLIGTPYSWADYAAIAALHLHLPSAALRRYVASSGHAMCSQLVDLCFLRAGIHLYSDGRNPGDVMPADLAALAEDWAARS